MNRRSHQWVLGLVMMTLLSGCAPAVRPDPDKSGTAHVEPKKSSLWLPTADSAGQVLLYDRFDQRIVAYDTARHKITKKNETLNYLQYEFNDLSTDLYTAGHSIVNNFKIVRKGEKKTSVLYKAERNIGLFPLAYGDSEHQYYLSCVYREEGVEIQSKRVVCCFEERTRNLIEIESTRGMRITNGVVIGSALFFTTYDETKDKFELYSMDPAVGGKPALMNDELLAGDIYAKDDELWISDKSKMYSYRDPTLSFAKKDLNYFYHGRLFQLYANSEGDLELRVVNTESGKPDAVIKRVVDVRAMGDKVLVYTYDGIEQL